MKMATKTLAELDKIICDGLGISIEKYNSMTLSEQFKIRTKYVRMINKKSNQLNIK
jgi:hypothetical protein